MDPEDAQSEFLASVAIMVVTLALGLYIWTEIFDALSPLLPKGGPMLWAVGTLLLINAAHFLFGVGRGEDKLPSSGGMSASLTDFVSIIAFLIKTITVSPSINFRSALIALRYLRVARRK